MLDASHTAGKQKSPALEEIQSSFYHDFGIDAKDFPKLFSWDMFIIGLKNSD